MCHTRVNNLNLIWLLLFGYLTMRLSFLQRVHQVGPSVNPKPQPKCFVCDKVFESKDYLEMHVSQVHPADATKEAGSHDGEENYQSTRYMYMSQGHQPCLAVAVMKRTLRHPCFRVLTAVLYFSQSTTSWPSCCSEEVDRALESRALAKLMTRNLPKWNTKKRIAALDIGPLSADREIFIETLRSILEVEICTEFFFFGSATRSSRRTRGVTGPQP